MDFLSMLTSSMTSDDSLSALTQASGASKDQVSSLVSSALPQLMSAMAGNAKSADGAASLMKALSQHTSTASVSDQIKNADAVDGGKILSHLLGGNSNSVLTSLASQNSMSTNQVSSILSLLTPALMSSVSAQTDKKKKSGFKFDLSDGFDLNDVLGLATMATGTSSSKKSSGILGLIGSLFKK